MNLYQFFATGWGPTGWCVSKAGAGFVASNLTEAKRALWRHVTDALGLRFLSNEPRGLWTTSSAPDVHLYWELGKVSKADMPGLPSPPAY